MHYDGIEDDALPAAASLRYWLLVAAVFMLALMALAACRCGLVFKQLRKDRAGSGGQSSAAEHRAPCAAALPGPPPGADTTLLELPRDGQHRDSRRAPVALFATLLVRVF